LVHDFSEIAEVEERLPVARGLPASELTGSLPVIELPAPPEPGQAAMPEIEVRWSRVPWWRCRALGWLWSSCGVSLVVHAALLLLLAWLVTATLSDKSLELVAWFDEPEDVATAPAPRHDAVVTQSTASPSESPPLEMKLPTPQIGAPDDIPLQPRAYRRDALGMAMGSPADWLKQADASVAGALAGRAPEARTALVQAGGGNPRSELAVERGLRWLMAQQCNDGSWDFNHHRGLSGATSPDPGDEGSATAATALVLLPYLGAGYTHKQGEYQEVVGRALYYLSTHALVTPHGVDLQDGTMYGQGLATIAVCEAYAMTEDPALRSLAQGAIDFVVFAQNTEGGGWRYAPGEPGDMTVTGWQLMGLKSGQMARLNVPTPAIFNAQRFLGSLQSDNGSQYGYLDPAPRRSTTAIGLLMRMYTGWDRENPGLQRGVEHLSQWGPSDENIYYDYYATQVMHHWGGPLWQRWNGVLRDLLVAAQVPQGPAAGSWFFPRDPGAREGGRLYSTAMAVMTLEVYYRHLPLYGENLWGQSALSH
jgi:hypothetical protein